MKKIIFVLVFIITTAISVEGHNYYNKHVTISIQTFYDELFPYGDWVNTPEYGYVWRPTLNDQEDFRPYSSGGNWVYTDIGWTWVSDYRWGWATFHYGRWYYDDYLGWMWIPGNEWAPAWVTWGSYNDLWAWAPMGPNIQVNFNPGWYAPHFWWTFVPRQHFCSNNWYSYIYNQPVQVTNITWITNIYYNNNYQRHNGNWFYGPRVSDVEKHMKTRVRKMQLVDTDNPGYLIAHNNRVNIYRPVVTNTRENSRPAKYRTIETLMADQKNKRTTDPGMKRPDASVAESQKANRNEPAPGSVKRNMSYNKESKRSNMNGQKTVESSRLKYEKRSQTPTSDRINGKSNDAGNLSGSRKSSRSSMESR
jgi:hypothetical protein